ncbi:MAG: 6-pyruvoyltetrahydropterin/6-carboxytetrahydropterin synthase [Kiritimatiellia bacterium]|jgi:6-pyruvoyltetrahydropterin/6-carboxytetrahydropterin synthase
MVELDIFKQDMKFSAGHFTIFSATHRENLHGHNFTIRVVVKGTLDEEGMLGDYGVLKGCMKVLCGEWNETFLLPGDSPHLRIHMSDDDDEVRVHFNEEVLRFLRRDVTVLPLKNISIEELSGLFGERLIRDPWVANNALLTRIDVVCGSGPGQLARWSKSLV